MKKILLSTAIALLAGGALVSAQSFESAKALPIKKAAVASQNMAKAPTADGYDIRFCEDIYNWYALSKTNKLTYTCYIYITPEMATALAGNRLTNVTFSAYIQSASSLSGSVFVSEDISGDPVVSQDATILPPAQPSESQTVSFENPYEIKENTGFYFGYVVKSVVSNKDYPVGIDGSEPSPYAGAVKLTNSLGVNKGSFDMATDLGTNLFLYAQTVGEKHALDNVFTVGDATLGNFTLPVVNAENGVTAYLPINNFGSNSITSVKYAYTSAEGELVESTIDTDVPSNANTYVELPLGTPSFGRNDVTVEVKEVNGIPCDVASDLSFIALDNEGYTRNFVVEEGTGTGCGYCPLGIVGMDYMKETYPERFIGIAAHCDWFGTDPMTVASYQGLLQKNFNGLPSCIINRDPIFNISPSKDYLEYMYEVWMSQPAIAEISLSTSNFTADTTSIDVTAKTVFALDQEKANYRLAFVITEDGLKGAQTNYYAGGRYGDMGGWEDKGSTVAWTYSDVARDIFDCWGLIGSVPTKIEKGTEYTYTYTLPLNNIYIGTGKSRQGNIDNTAIVALLIDTKTGVVLNAAKITAADYDLSAGINDVTADIDNQNAPVEYFNLQGIRMNSDNLPAGIYIMKQGNVVKKIKR